MTWGTGPWGVSPWGGVDGGPPAPTLISVSSGPGPATSTALPAAVDERGGTVCLAVGTHFTDPLTIEILAGVSPYTVVGKGFIFDPEFDVESSRCYFGAPKLERGLYHVRLSTDGGSVVLENAIAAREFADDFKIVSARGKWSSVWATGTRVLRG